MADYVAGVIAEWGRERPGLDVASMEVTARILRAAQLLQASLDDIASRYGLSHKGDLDVLTALRRSGEPFQLTPSTLARAVQLTTGGMTTRLDRLERAELVSRSANPSDRRGVLVGLTDEGRALADDAMARALVEQERLLTPLSAEDRRTLADALERLLTTLGDEEDRTRVR